VELPSAASKNRASAFRSGGRFTPPTGWWPEGSNALRRRRALICPVSHLRGVGLRNVKTARRLALRRNTSLGASAGHQPQRDKSQHNKPSNWRVKAGLLRLGYIWRVANAKLRERSLPPVIRRGEGSAPTGSSRCQSGHPLHPMADRLPALQRIRSLQLRRSPRPRCQSQCLRRIPRFH
jgi:hypothetical protein